MNTLERRHQIVQAAITTGKVYVIDLVEKHKVSAVTIRTDLNHLHQNNILIRFRGGALSSNKITKELSIDDKSCDQVSIKKALAKRVVQELNENESIILDSGTTTAEVARQLSSFRRLVIMTNGLNVMENLTQYEEFEVLMTGGTYREKSKSFYGRQAEDSLERYHFDKVILGVDGLDFHSGITTHFEHDAILNRIMCRVAKEVIVITDSSKFNVSGMHQICTLKHINTLVTDSGIPEAFAVELEKNGVNLIIVNKST